MSDFFDGHTLTLTCRPCGHEVEYIVSQLKRNPEITCPNCGVTTKYNAAEFERPSGVLKRPSTTSEKKTLKTIKLGH